MSPKPAARSPNPRVGDEPAYLAALRFLSRRELSEFQVRQRLARKGHAAADIDAAVERLKTERAIDDARVAAAIARTSVTVRRRGWLRVRRDIEAAGIEAGVARAALDEVLDGTDADALLQAALARRLRGDRLIEDDREFRRLYRFLASQGFESDRILKALNARRSRHSSGGNDQE